jgi:hypothetical protein
MDISGSGSFGSNDSLACTKCGGAMYLIRRGPHPTLGTGWEIQMIERSADTDGNPHAA